MREYRQLIQRFLSKGYRVEFFSDSPDPRSVLLLRHDIDFDVRYADEMSQVEDEMGVKATYFFLLHSASYNLLETENMERIRSMHARGHQVSIHFDPTLYDDIESGFAKEKRLFESMFDVTIQFTSIHRPSDFFLNRKEDICGVRHTYQPAYFDDIKYFADSAGSFRYGHPCESATFERRDTIQLLTHPVWWVTGEGSPIAKLEEFLDYRIEVFRRHMGENCKPFAKHLAGDES